ncbi:unnamed protein product [Chrysoparadoxa australica]
MGHWQLCLWLLGLLLPQGARAYHEPSHRMSRAAFIRSVQLARPNHHLGAKKTKTRGVNAVTRPPPHVGESLKDERDPQTAVSKLLAALPSKEEGQKLAPLGLMFFFILFDYTILRDTKDVLVVTSSSSGAAVIPFLKTYINLPCAVAFTAIYSKLCNMLTQEKLFYTIIVPFLLFFGGFGLFVYPNRELLHPVEMAAQLSSALPAGLAPVPAILNNWESALFYTMSELWGSVVISVLFWGFANEVMTVGEAKRWYPLFGLGANFALICSGQYVRFVSAVRANLPEGADPWGVSLQLLMAAVVGGGGLVVACHAYLRSQMEEAAEVEGARAHHASSSSSCLRLLPSHSFPPPPAAAPADCQGDIGCALEKAAPAKGKETTTLSVKESIRYLASNNYVKGLAALVICYGSAINIVEVTWKSNLREAFPDPNAYSAFMGNFSSATGATTLVVMLLSTQVFQQGGWRPAAKITPLMLLLTGAVFFSLILFGDAPFAQGVGAILGTTPLLLAVGVGAAQNLLSKSCKYAFFDPCKEIAYIPLPPEEKRKGKAAVDVIGNPLGKSAGSFLQQALLLGCGSLDAATPYLGGSLLVIVMGWLLAADALADSIEASEAAGP